ncbi:MAG: hypothetical protein M3422_05420 [Actinomycetota bacterium]|nr:hypothetical protein [Actinomycetota bacterium]
MNWAFVVTTVAAIGVGAITNELCDLAPWLAVRLVRLAARLEAATPEEKHLLFEEMSAMLDEVPGKLTKLLFSIGRLTYAARHVRWRRRRTNATRIRIICQMALSGAIASFFFVMTISVTFTYMFDNKVSSVVPAWFAAGLTILSAIACRLFYLVFMRARNTLRKPKRAR